MRNSEKTAPKVPPNLLISCMGLKAVKEARCCNENDPIGIAVVDLAISEKIQPSNSTASYRLQREV